MFYAARVTAEDSYLILDMVRKQKKHLAGGGVLDLETNFYWMFFNSGLVFSHGRLLQQLLSFCCRHV